MARTFFQFLAFSSKVLAIRIAVVSLWFATVGAGFVVLSNYQSTGGSAGKAPQHWPESASVPLDRSHNTLLMFAHPHCPCTRASVEELNRLMGRLHNELTVHVLFFKPSKFQDDWTRSGLWRSASAIPGVTVQDDSDGAQARLFGAETSGFVLLYDSHGQLLFKGGITSGRGHAGDNAGESAIVSMLSGESVSLKETPVYGCSLLGKCDISSTDTAP